MKPSGLHVAASPRTARKSIVRGTGNAKLLWRRAHGRVGFLVAGDAGVERESVWWMLRHDLSLGLALFSHQPSIGLSCTSTPYSKSLD